jgi:hypothetical protein
VFDSRLTAQANLVRLDDMGIDFITLRRRAPQLLEQVDALPASAWRTVELDVPTRRYRTPRMYEQTVTISGRAFRQLFIDEIAGLADRWAGDRPTARRLPHCHLASRRQNRLGRGGPRWAAKGGAR